MAGGDLLYIFAFIILPTAVLVSCIWALVLLRKGALLPERPVRRYAEPDAEVVEDDEPEPGLVEETGEHVVIEPGRQPKPVVAATAATAPVVEERPATSASQAAAQVAAVLADVPVVERTQEMSAVPIEAVADEVAPTDEPPAELVEVVEVVEVVEAGDAPVAPAPASNDDDLLIVPLDEPLPRFTNGRAELTLANADDEAAAEAEPLTSAAPERRRQTRRPVRLRPGEAEPARPRPRIGQRRTNRRHGQ